MAQRVRKAVLPVAGLGTRFLPATKAMPKEMLTVVDRPLIQYAIEECLAAGIEEFVFVTGRNKSALEDHFDAAYELEDTLVKRGKKPELKQTQAATIKPGNAIFTRQQQQLDGFDETLASSNPLAWGMPYGAPVIGSAANRLRFCCRTNS